MVLHLITRRHAWWRICHSQFAVYKHLFLTLRGQRNQTHNLHYNEPNGLFCMYENPLGLLLWLLGLRRILVRKMVLMCCPGHIQVHTAVTFGPEHYQKGLSEHTSVHFQCIHSFALSCPSRADVNDRCRQASHFPGGVLRSEVSADRTDTFDSSGNVAKVTLLTSNKQLAASNEEVQSVNDYNMHPFRWIFSFCISWMSSVVLMKPCFVYVRGKPLLKPLWHRHSSISLRRLHKESSGVRTPCLNMNEWVYSFHPTLYFISTTFQRYRYFSPYFTIFIWQL